MKKPRHYGKTLYQSLRLIFVILVIIYFYRYLTSSFIPKQIIKPPISMAKLLFSERQYLKTVSLKEARKIYQSIEFQEKKVFFMDVRDYDRYVQGHIEEALPSLPGPTAIHSFLTRLEKETPLLLYCTTLECQDAVSISQTLIKMGFQRLFLFPRGFQEWTSTRLPIESGVWSEGD